MITTSRPRPLTGALVGLLLTAPLLALFFVGERLAGLPLPPFDVFDWLARVLPGDVITFGIDSIAGGIRALGGGDDLSTIAKLTEQVMAVGALLIMGLVAGAVVFVVMNAAGGAGLGRNLALGALAGAVAGALAWLLSEQIGFAETGMAVNAVWLFATTMLGGALHGWAYDALARRAARKTKTAATTTTTDAEVRQLSRRDFLVRLGGAAATITVIGAGVALAVGPRGADAPPVVTGDDTSAPPDPNAVPDRALAFDAPVPGVRPEITPVPQHYRIDINTRALRLDGATWTLPFTGLVNNERAYTIDDLRAFPSTDQWITLQCISNEVGGSLISTTRWTGVPVRDVLNDLGLQDGAEWLFIRGVDGFFESVAIADVMADERIIFCYDWDGAPLPDRNGFPLRIYIPDLYGMKQPKWIESIEVRSDYERGYWVVRNWSEEARMQTTSFIDAVAVNDLLTRDGALYVPVGGYAVAGARGISRVEVQVNDGDWQEAAINPPLSETTWVQWRFDWPFEEGNHTFRVRTYEADGTLQPETTRGPRPNGATGINSERALVRTPAAASA